MKQHLPSPASAFALGDAKSLFVDHPSGTARALGVALATVLRLERLDPDFPKPIALTERKKLLSVRQLLDWVELRRDRGPLPPLRPTLERRKI